MKKLVSSILALTALMSPAMAFAKAVVVTPLNLKEYNFEMRDSDRDCWRTTFLVATETYSVEGCAGSETEATMRFALERVYKSPIQERCLKEKICDYGHCREIYGQRELNVELKVISNNKNQVQDWVQREIYSPCL